MFHLFEIFSYDDVYDFSFRNNLNGVVVTRDKVCP